MDHRLDAHLAKENRYVLEDDYWQDMQDAAAIGGVDVVILLEETPFEDWLRRRRVAYRECPQ